MSRKSIKYYKLCFNVLFFYSTQSFAQEPSKQRNPFCFPEKPVTPEKKVDPDPIMHEKELHLVKTETKWQVTTVLPASVIVQHKEDGQIREIALSQTNTCS